MQFYKSATACSLAALVLAACGANDTSINGNIGTQSKQLVRQTKSATSTYQTAVESLYVAYFGRPADPNGLANFSAALQTANAPTDIAGLLAAYTTNPGVKSLIDSFGTSNESQKLYGGGTTTAFVTAVFQNVLGRSPQSSGLAYWVNAIDSGTVTTGEAALSIMNGALTNKTAQGLLDAQLVNNRLAAAGFFSGAATAATYTGATAAAAARTMLATINANTSSAALQSTAVTEAQAINNQTVFESTALNGGEWYVYDNIPYGGGALVPGKNYVYAEVINALTQSPATAAQQAITHNTSLDPALSAPGAGVTRVLVGGQVLLQPALGLRKVSYAGGGIQVQYYDSNQQTIVATSQFDNYAAVSLSGQMALSPEELQAAVPIKEWIADNNFAATATWQSGSGYIKHQGHAVGDQYDLADCTNVPNPTTTTGTTPSPCVTGGSLSGIFPITLYQTGGHPYETDYASDGTIATVQGLQMWIANNPKPPGESYTAEYRIFVQMNGNVYLGSLTKDGASYRYEQADGSVVNYSFALNQVAAASVGAGLITGSGVGSKAGAAAAVSDTVDLFGIGGTGVNGSLSPADLRAHYNVPAGLTGAGQTVVIVDAPSSADIEDDLNTYSQYYNLPACTTANGCFQHVDLSQGAAVTAAKDWGGEPNLDVQMVHAIAPGAKIILITSASNNSTDLFGAVNYAYTLPNVTAVSMSFGGGIYSSVTQTFNNAVQTGGPIFFASSGDGGYSSSPSFPAIATSVIAVGGTRINAVNWTSAASESGWQFSGGGSTTSFANTSWMTQLQPQSILLGARGVPDVAAVADFQNSALSIYSKDAWGLSGGTSASAPIWAGFAALFGHSLGANNQSLLSKLGTPQGGFSEILYQMAASANSDSLFYRSNSGSNNLTNATCQLCIATGNYNEVTGLGAPNIQNMVAYLGGTVPTAAIDAQLGKPAYRMTRARMMQRHLPLVHLVHLVPVATQGF
jgi:hypothetical protein